MTATALSPTAPHHLLYSKDDLGALLTYIELEYLFGDEYRVSQNKPLSAALASIIEHTRISAGLRERTPQTAPLENWHQRWEMLAAFFDSLGAPKLHRVAFLALVHEMLGGGVGAAIDGRIIGCIACAHAAAQNRYVLPVCESITRGVLDPHMTDDYLQYEPPYAQFTFEGPADALARLQATLRSPLQARGGDSRLASSLIVTAPVTKSIALAGAWAEQTARAHNVHIRSFFGFYSPLE